MPSVTLTPTSFTNDASIVYAGADELAWNLTQLRIDAIDQLDDYSEYLFMTGLNAAIPAGSTIDGVLAEWDRQNNSSDNGFGQPAVRVVDLEVRMVIGGVVAGTDKKLASQWSTLSEQHVQYGGATDKWGNTPTVSQVNAGDFGIALAMRCSAYVTGGFTTVDIDAPTVTIYYTPPATGEAQVTLFANISPAIASAQKDVALFAAISRDANKDVALSAVIGPFIDLTEPDSGDTITTAELLVTWDSGPTVQSDYRVRVYSDSSETTLVYDSGIVGSTEEQHLIPSGQLPSGNLWIRVTIHDLNQMEGRSALVDFTTSFPTSVDVTGVAATTIGGCDAPLVLPGVKVTWDEITPGAGETFVRYEVRRRPATETTYTTIAHAEDVAETEYKDYAVAPSQVYEYAVVWVATSGASTLISAEQASPARERVKFDFTFLHSVADPTRFLRLEHWEAVVELLQPVDTFEPWGRETPTAYTGEQFSHTIAIPLHGHPRKKPQTWEKLLELARQQRSGDVLCLRIGRDRERYFVVMRRPRKQVRQKTYEPSVELVEVNYDEAVTA